MAATLMLLPCAAKEKPGKVMKKTFIVDGKEYVKKVKYIDFTEYDQNGNETHYKFMNRFESWYEYDSNGNEIHIKIINEGKIETDDWLEYDEKGNELHKKTSNGYEIWSQYDEQGNEIYSRNSDGKEYHWSYDNYGNMLYADRDGDEYFYEYEFYPDGKVKIQREYTTDLKVK